MTACNKKRNQYGSISEEPGKLNKQFIQIHLDLNEENIKYNVYSACPLSFNRLHCLNPHSLTSGVILIFAGQGTIKQHVKSKPLT